MPSALLKTECPTLTLIARGKVRDIYAVDHHDEALLFVATDRVSAFDVIMKNVCPALSPFRRSDPASVVPTWPSSCRPGLIYDSSIQGIPNKGKLLTQLSLFFFNYLATAPATRHIPNHVITSNIDEMPADVQLYKDQLEGRAIWVKRAQVLPVEAIVRGYITGNSSHPLPSRAPLTHMFRSNQNCQDQPGRNTKNRVRCMI